MQGGNPQTGQPQAPRGPGKPQSTEGPGRVRKPSARSRVANGKRLLPLADGRSIWARLFSDTYASLIAHCGGEGYISEPRRLLARRAALYETELIIIENQLAQLRGTGNMKMLARKIALEWLAQYQTMTNSQRRCLEALGIERKALKDITPSLANYIKQVEAKKAEGGGVVPLECSEQAGAGLGKFTATTKTQDAEVVE